MINYHLNGLQSRPQHPFWRNFTELGTDPVFDRMASTVHTYDIDSQYANAASNPLPVGERSYSFINNSFLFYLL